MIDRSKPLSIHEFPSLIDEVARLKAAHDNEFMQMGQYVDILLATAPAMLDVLSEIRAGDADILYWMLTGVGDDPSQDDIAGLLSRYHDIARKMEENR